MRTLTIRHLDDRTHARIRLRAVMNGRSVEAEVRAMLDAATAHLEENLLLATHAAFAGNGVELSTPERSDRPRLFELSELQDGGGD